MSAAVEQTRATFGPTPTEGTQEPAQPGASVARSMVPRADRGWLELVEEWVQQGQDGPAVLTRASTLFAR
jgi:hypothetical protein